MSVARRASHPDVSARLGPALRMFYTHASPLLLSAIAAGCAGLRAALGGWSAWDAVVVAGILAFWPLQEWLIHVFILHHRPVSWFGRTLDFKASKLHRAHHRDPWQLDLVFIPLHVYLYTPVVVGAIWLFGGPRPELLLSALVVYFLLALHYEWVHFLVHTRYHPRSAVYRRLWTNHRRHHFKNEHYWFGVTMLGGDRLLRTAPDFRSVPSSPTARTLGLEDTLGETANPRPSPR